MRAASAHGWLPLAVALLGALAGLALALSAGALRGTPEVGPPGAFVNGPEGAPRAVARTVDGHSAADLLRRSQDAMAAVPEVSWILDWWLITGGWAEHQQRGTVPGPALFDMARGRGIPAGQPQEATAPPRIVGQGTIDGRPAWVVWYAFWAATTDSRLDVGRTAWIDQETFRLLRLVEDVDDTMGSPHRLRIRTNYPDWPAPTDWPLSPAAERLDGLGRH